MRRKYEGEKGYFVVWLGYEGDTIEGKVVTRQSDKYSLRKGEEKRE